MRRVRLRTKFLLSLLAISAGLTAATLLIVSYVVQKRVRENIGDDLRTSVSTYQSFEQQREDMFTRSAQLLANLPNVRALMTTGDAATIQDGSEKVWQLSGADLLILASRTGTVLGSRSADAGLAQDMTQDFLRHSLEKGEAHDWWFGGGHLYEIWIQPIYSGPSSENLTLGFLAVGQAIDDRAARSFGSITSSEVAFYYGDSPVASTLSSAKQNELIRQLHTSSADAGGPPADIHLGRERYLAQTVRLSVDPVVTLSVFKSFDKATSFLSKLNNILLGLGLLTVIIGSALVFWISHTFTQPLASLVAGVRALEGGDFSYPLENSRGDEVAEVTGAFNRMRTNLQKTQEEQKQMEQRLRQAHKMEAVGRLAGGIAHDFNNLLTIICGNSDLLTDREGADDFQRRCAEQIQKAARRAVTMTRQLLAFSRMQVLQPQVLDLNAVMADMSKMLPRLIGEHIEYVFQPESKLATVKADPGQIEQVIMNLAVNARDAMADGGTLIVKTSNVIMDELEAAKRPPMNPGSYVLLSVTDNGHGMDEKTKAHIFEPFFTTKEIGKGTGLGLATVYGVVKQSGGFIWVESAPGKGTTFEIYLPESSGMVMKAEVEPKLSAAPSGTETVLVVEDEAGVRELACKFLTVKGYSVLEAKDGVEALEIVAQHKGVIHAILTDMVMPRMGGVDLVRKLRVTHPDMKVVFMSGYSEYSKGNLGEVFPQSLILQKPFSPTSLVETVRKVLTKKPADPMKDTEECRVT